MNPKERFFEALELEGPARDVYMERLEREDPAGAARVRELLAADSKADEAFGAASVEWSPGLRMRAAAEGAADLEPVGEVAGYRLGSVLGEGGFGIVYEAEQREPVARRVALKLLRPGFDSAAILARFDGERRALERMDHPHVARMLDGGATDSGRPFFVMELVRGAHITDWCRARNADLVLRLRVFMQVCRGVQHAHEKGVIHRDLKPSNVLVGIVDDEPTAKIIDFGIAKAVEGQLSEAAQATRSGAFLGTPAYMSPEQLDPAADVDTLCDVYALGALLYELTTGRPPFETDALPLHELVRRVREELPTRPSQVTRTEVGTAERRGTDELVPADLDWVVLRCLEKDPARRYATASELALDLKRFLSGRPVEAAPPSEWYRLRKFARRHRLAVAAAALLLISLIGGILGTSLGLSRARSANSQLGLALAETTNANAALVIAREEAVTETGRARAALAEADRQARIAGAVQEFLTADVLQAASAWNERGLGRDATLLSALEAASARIEVACAPGGRFDGEPGVEAAVRAAIGSTLDGLGDRKQAEPQLARAFELFEHELGLDDPRTLGCGSRLADVWRSLGRNDESEALFERLLAHPGPLLEASDVSTLVALRRFGILRFEQGRRDEALGIFEGALGRARELLGVEHGVTLNLLNAVGNVYAAGGEPARAGALFREVWRARLRSNGAEDPNTLAAAVNLASQLRVSGALDEARELLEEAVPVMLEVIGDNDDTAVGLAELGQVLAATGEPEGAVAIYEQALEVAERTRGPSSPIGLAVRALLAKVLVELGELARAEVLAEQSLEATRARFGAEHSTTWMREVDAAVVELEAGRAERAEQRLRATIEPLERLVGPLHPYPLHARASLGRALFQQGRFEEAESVWLDARGRCLEVSGPGHPTTVELAARLLRLYLATGRARRAVDWGQEALAAASPEAEDGAPSLARLRLRLGLALAELGDREAAAELGVRAHEALLARYGADDSLTLEAASLLATPR